MMYDHESPYVMVKVMACAVLLLFLVIGAVVGMMKGTQYLTMGDKVYWEMSITVDSFGNKTTTCWEEDWTGKEQVQCDVLIDKVEGVLADRRHPRMPQ